jgi:hypothetical protein
MLKKTLSRFALSALLISSGALATSLARNPEQSLEAQTGTLEKMMVAGGNVALNLDVNRLEGRASQEMNLETFRFGIDSNSFFTVLAFDNAFRGPQPGTMKLLWGNSATLPTLLNASADQLVVEKTNSGSAFDLVVRDARTGFVFFNIEGINYNFNADQHSLDVADARLLISPELAAQLGRSADAGNRVGTISINANVNSYEVSTIVNGTTQSAVLPSRANPDDPNSVPGPDVIVGDLPSMDQFGTAGTQVGLGIGTTSCNNGTVDLNWFALPQVDHPVIPQNLYRMSGGTTNTDRFEQIGQSWLKHAFTALTDNACGFGCNGVGGSHLGVGCSDPYGSSLNAGQTGLGSRAWVNPFTGAYPSTSNSHTGHNHSGTTHRLLVEMADLNTTQNPGAMYFGEAQYISPHEYTWCQSHAGQCNMYNNASYRRFNVSGTTSFSFSSVGSTVRMQPAIMAWTGATINAIEPAPGVDGRALLGYKVSGPVGGVWHYEYAISNQNLDRGVQSFTIPLGCGINLSNVGFHAPTNPPGIANDGTINSAGYSNTPWAVNQSSSSISWKSDTVSADPNANALRWGTMYNFRFDSTQPPQSTYAVVGFFKSGAPIQVQIQGPTATACQPGSRR